MKRIFSLCFIALFISCNSTDDSSDIQNEEPNFYALKVGNSWVFKSYKYNINSELYEDTGVIDSVSIIGTEELNSNTYFKFRRWTTGNEQNISLCYPNGEHFELLRDSIGYLVSSTGGIRFINNDYNDILMNSQNWGDQYYQLQNDTFQVATDAGTFDCLMVSHFVLSGDEVLPGKNSYYYVDGIGKVFEKISFVSNPIPTIERRLDSYVIQ